MAECPSMQVRYLVLLAAVVVCTTTAVFAQSLHFKAERLEKNPIITPQMFADAGVPKDGRNINGPSLIRLPDWLPKNKRANPNANYYLYFADHGGKYIRMAWSDKIEGPYHLYKPGKGVLSLYGDQSKVVDAKRNRRVLFVGKSLGVEGHIASPDVIVDYENKQFVMFFHGFAVAPYGNGGHKFTGPDGETWKRLKLQRSFVTTSSDGLGFNGRIKPEVVGGAYLRVFQVHGEWFGSSYSSLKKADKPNTLLTRFGTRLGRLRTVGGVRHTAVRVGDDGVVTVFFSRKGGKPEHIEYVTIRHLGVKRPNQLDISEPVSLLKPREKWEGSHLPIVQSKAGGSDDPVHQLRDPGYFKDADGSEYLLYSVAGEKGIAIARLHAMRTLTIHE